jgi:hypothetical protein
LFSILNNIWIQTPGDPPRLTEPDWRHIVTGDRPFFEDVPPALPLNGSELKATLDKKPIVFNPNTPIIRSQSPVFTASFPADNVFGADPSLLTGPIVSDGFWVMLPPLSPGTYELHFEARQGQQSFQNVTYTLTVK